VANGRVVGQPRCPMYNIRQFALLLGTYVYGAIVDQGTTSSMQPMQYDLLYISETPRCAVGPCRPLGGRGSRCRYSAAIWLPMMTQGQLHPFTLLLLCKNYSIAQLVCFRSILMICKFPSQRKGPAFSGVPYFVNHPSPSSDSSKRAVCCNK
jgi:hypothetical protein